MIHRILLCLLLLLGLTTNSLADSSLGEQAEEAMKRATQYFCNQVSTRGGYLWAYSPDLTMRLGELPASATTIWVQPPGTPTVGMAYLDAYGATENPQYLDAARDAAGALVWGQLASGGWDHYIDFHPEHSKKWYYRRDLEAGDLKRGKRRNRTYFDDDITQSALRFLMRIDEVTHFKDFDIHRAAIHGLTAILEAQYPNGAWPQRYDSLNNTERISVQNARYPETWSRTHPNITYFFYYTLNDNAIVDLITTLLEAAHTYGDPAYREAAKKGGEFLVLAQMPDPQPAWAQQYNANMEPSWARRFEPPAITGGESIRVIQALLDLYVETGESRFLAPVPRALDWANRSLLPDGQLARFYELQTNRPLYFTKDYVLTYSDTDLPDHYAFKVSASRLKRAGDYYERIQTEGRDLILEASRNRLLSTNQNRVKQIIAALDDEGRWIEMGSIKDPENPRRKIQSEIISTRAFARNMTYLSRYVAAQK